MLRKTLAWLLAIMMVLTVAPISAFATEAEIGQSQTSETQEVVAPISEVVAKVGSTEYATIDEAIANWANGKTLTLLADVTLSDVIQLSSTEHHILDLGTYTMTAASNKDAIQIVNNGRSSASYALDIKADATDPGGITATGKAVVKTTGQSGVKDRPIIRFYGGVFTGTNVVYHSGSNGTNCPQFWFYGGEFNGTVYANRAKFIFYGGTFNGSLQISVDSSADALIVGGTFKQLSNLYGSSLNTDKFTIGSAAGVYDREVYVNDDGYYVVAVADPAEGIEAAVAKNPGTNDYFAYSKVATEGALNYTDAVVALENNNTTSAKVTIYADEIDLAGINFKGTIVVPEGETLTIYNAPEGLKTEGTVEVVVPVAKIGDVEYTDLQEAINAAQNGDEIVLLANLEVIGETFTIAADKAITLNMNGKKITATDNKAASVSYELFYNYGELTVTGNGTIELTSTSNDTAYAKSSTIFHNRGGVLTVENGTFKHLGGTAMAYVIDNSANSFGDAYLYVKGGEIISKNYIAIRMRMEDPNANGNPGNGLSFAEVTGGYIYGANRGIWGQKSSGANEKQGQLTVTDGVVENNRADRGAIQIDTDSYEVQNMLVSISGNATIKGAIMGGDDEFVVSGGTFTVAVPEKYCAEGFEPKANEDGTFGVQEAKTYVAEVNGVRYESLQAAVNAAQEGNVIEVIGEVSDEAVTVDKNVTITGSVVLNNVSISANGATELTVSGLSFTGNSWINVGTATKLTVSGVTADVTPSNASATNSRSAFISLGRSEQHQLALTVENCNIISRGGSDPILGWASITEANLIGNTFGAADAYQSNSDSVKFMAVAAGAVINVVNNTVYSNYNGIVIAQNTTRDNSYTATFDGNTFMGGADHIWLELGVKNVYHGNINLKSNNTINGNAVTVDDIKTYRDNGVSGYAGIDVVLNGEGKVVGGTMKFAADGTIADGYELDDNGVVVKAQSYVAEVNGVQYETLQAALEAAKAMTGDVVVGIYDKVTLSAPLTGSYDSITFVGKDTDAEIYLDIQGYVEAPGKKVAFEDLILSKVSGGYITNAGFMNLAFGIYGASEVTYNNCTFANGAYASSGKNTFTGCTFYSSYDRYGMFAYGAPEVVVDGCTFADIRGIKMYAEGGVKVTNLTVKNTDFTAATGKPAIVLTYGASVTLKDNTYPTTGVFELDLDGAPNGTAVNVPSTITCVNDNGACGVIVDGKIYTTVAQAAAVAVSGSNVTLLHDSAETVELAEGVILNKNGYTADGVTVKVSYVAQVGDAKFKTLSEAFAAITDDNQTVVILTDVTENLTGAYLRGKIVAQNGAKVTITLTNSDWVYCPYTFVLGENITLNVPKLFYYAGGTIIKGTVVAGAYYQRYAGTKLTIEAPGSLTVTSETFILRYMDGDPNAGIYIIGDNNDSTVELKLAVAYFYQGMINAKNATIVCGTYWQTQETDNEGSANLVLDNSKLTVTVYDHAAKATGNSTVTLTNGSTMTCPGGLTVDTGSTMNVEGSTLVVKGTTTTNKNLWISGNSVVKIENLNGRATVLDDTTLTNSYIKSATNGTTRVLGDLTLKGGFGAAYFMTAGTATDTSGYEGTITIEDGTTLDASYGVEFNGDVTLNGGKVKLSGGNASGKLWGMVFQSGEFVINSDLVVVGNAGAYAPIHFTDATVTVNGSISQSNSGGEPLYIGDESNVTFGADAVIDTLSIHGAGKLNLFVDANGNYAEIKCGASGFTGELAVVGNTKYEAKKVDGKIVVALKPVAMIGTQGYATLADAIAAAQAGDTIELLADVSASEVILIGKSITINGNGHTITSSATRIFRITTGNVKVTMNDLNMVNNAVRVGTNDIRGVSIDTGFTGIELTLNNCTVDFTDASATDWSYAVNVVGGSNHTITINGGIYEGANVINLWGNGHKVTIENAKLTSIYGINELYVGSIVRVENALEKVTLKNNTFNGDHAVVISYKEGASVAVLVEENNIDNTKKYTVKVGTSYYYSLAEALAAAQAGDTVTLLADVTASEIITIDKAITLDGNGCTLTSTAGRAINASGANGVTIKNLTIVCSGERAINVIQNATNVTIENVTATATNYTVNIASSAPNAVVAIKDSTLNGLCTVNVSAVGAQVTVDNSTINCNDNNTTAGEGYAAISLNKEAIGGSIIATSTTVNVAAGSDSVKGRNGAEDGVVTINGSTEGVYVVVAVITYPGSNYYYGFASIAKAIEFAKAGDTITLIRDVTTSETINITKDVTIDGNGHTLTYTGSDRAITVEASANGANLTLKNLTVDCTASYCQRGINYNTTGELTLENVTVKGTNVTYALNLPGSSDNCVVEITDSSLTGNIALNIWGANSTITADNSVFTSVDKTPAEGYVAISLNNDGAGNAATGSVVTINGGKIIAKDENGEASTAVRVETTATVNVSKETEVVGDTKYDCAIVIYEGYTDFYSFDNLQDAINKAIESNGKVVLINNITIDKKLTISDSVVIDGNSFTITYTGSDRAIDIPANDNAKVNVTIENLTVDCTASYCQRGINYNDDGALVLNNVTVKGTNVTYALNLPGSSDNCVVTITDSNISGNIALNVWGENATINATNTTFTAVDNNTVEGYAAVKLNNDGTTSAEGSVINIVGGKIDVTGSACADTEAVSNGTANGDVNISDTTVVNGKIVEMVAVIRYAGGTSYSFYNLADAIAAAQDGETIALLADINVGTGYALIRG